MMDTMINEEGLSFKDVEEYFFKYICEQGRKMTCEFLEKYDRYLMENRDRASYRHKGYRQATIKTVYGEVEYRRSVYEVKRDDGTHEYVFLLDEQLHIKGVGLISQNFAEQLVSGITEMSYRNCADKISHTTGQSISAMGVWNVIQGLGEAVCEDERQLGAWSRLPDAGYLQDTGSNLMFSDKVLSSVKNNPAGRSACVGHKKTVGGFCVASRAYPAGAEEAKQLSPRSAR